MNLLTDMTPAHAAALQIGMLLILLLVLKIYVGTRRTAHKIAPGDTSNPDFARALRVQHNAVEDVPALMVGLAVLAMIGMPSWYIHLAGGVLLVGRILHAVGLARSGGRSFGRFAGTIATLVAFLMIGGALIRHAFNASF
jgi:uncharacterized membrane protein YecN with MAPEG domain